METDTNEAAVSLPGMMASSSLDPESVALVRDYVNELLE